MPRNISWRALAALPIAALAVTSSPVAAQAADRPGWRAVATVTGRYKVTELESIAAGGPAAAWAVGISRNAGLTRFRSLLERWNGQAWARVNLRAALVSKLGGDRLLYVSASSPGNVWAFTFGGGWLHGNGRTWTAGRIRAGSPFIETSLATGAGGAWAFGETFTTSSVLPYAARYSQSRGWQRTRISGRGIVVAASAVSATDIWAVVAPGRLKASFRLIHWVSGGWHTVARLPGSSTAHSVNAMLARGDRSVWVGGSVTNSKRGSTETVSHWNGRRWTVTTLPAAASAVQYHVASIVADGSGGLWALGACTTGSSCLAGGPSRLWHETGGTWSGGAEPKLAGSQTMLTDLAAISRSVWACGDVVGLQRVKGLIALRGPTPH